MRKQHLSDAEIRPLSEKTAKFNFWWPRTDSVESSRQAAKGGSVAFGLTALGLLTMLAFAIFAGHGIAVEEYVSLFLLTPLFIYMTWRAYKRPTILLNCIALALMALPLGLGVIAMLAANKMVIAPLLMPLLATVSAVGGMRGSIAVRRFKAGAPPTGTSADS